MCEYTKETKKKKKRNKNTDRKRVEERKIGRVNVNTHLEKTNKKQQHRNKSLHGMNE